MQLHFAAEKSQFHWKKIKQNLPKVDVRSKKVCLYVVFFHYNDKYKVYKCKVGLQTV